MATDKLVDFDHVTDYISREAAIDMCDDDGDITRIRYIPAADVRPVVQRDAVMQALNKYFSIGDSYTYELNRVKEAFYVGTMTLDDFEEWNEDNVSDLCDYLMKELFRPNCGADMREPNLDTTKGERRDELSG